MSSPLENRAPDEQRSGEAPEPSGAAGGRQPDAASDAPRAERKKRFGAVDVVALVLAIVTFAVIVAVLVQNFLGVG